MFHVPFIFFSPLSLRHGSVVVCFEVTIYELLCPDGCAMWSRDPGWGNPWFPHGALLLCSPWSMTLWFCCSSLCFCCHTMSMVRWYNVITLALIYHELAPITPLFGCFVWFMFAFVWWVCFWFSCLVYYDFLTAYWTMRRSQLADGHVCVN